MVGATVLALIGIGLAWLFYGGGYREPAAKFAAAFPRFVRLVQDKFRIDELYDFLIVRPLRRLAQAIYFVVDRVIIDKILVEGVGGLVDVFARIARSPSRAATGSATWRCSRSASRRWSTSPRRPPVPDGLKVTVDRPDASTSTPAAAASRPRARSSTRSTSTTTASPRRRARPPTRSHAYPRPGQYTIRVDVKDPRWGTKDSLKQKVEVR